MKFRTKHTSLSIAAIAAVATLTLSGCSASGGDSAQDKTLNLGTLTPVETFAAKDARFANASPYMQAVYDTLLHADPDGKIQPWLATDWSYNSDKTVLTMTLRDDVVFSDGTKFDADVAAQNLERFKKGSSPQKGYLSTLKKASAPDKTTLKIELSEPNPALLSFLSQNPGLMESPKNFDTKNEDTNPVGSGPYMLDSEDTVSGSKYVFTKNDDYWGPDSQQVYSKIVMTSYDSSTAMLNAIKGGQLNAGVLNDTTTVKQVEASGYETYGWYSDVFGLLLSDRDGDKEEPLGDVRVRQAINYALDREGILKAAGQGYGKVTEQMFDPNSSAYDKDLDSTYEYDPDKARDLLKEAGYSNGDVVITEPQISGYPPAAYSLIKQELEDVGITVKYKQATGTMVADALAGKYASNLMQLKAGPTTWETITNTLSPDAGWNPFHYKDSKVDSLIDTIQHGDSAEDTQEAAQELNKHIVDEAWFAPLYFPQVTAFTDENTTLKTQVGNVYPYLWNIRPKK